MVKIVLLDANRPMKVGILCLGIAILIYIVHAITRQHAFWVAAVGVGVLGACIYLVGRVMMLWKKRF